MSKRKREIATQRRSQLRLAVFAPVKNVVSETFIRAHLERLPFEVLPRYGRELGIVNELGDKIWFWGRWFSAVARRISPKMNAYVLERFMARHLRACRVDAVLAEYGTNGSLLAPACARADVPLFVHFHGFDASDRTILKLYRSAYLLMFDSAEGIVVVSKVMRQYLLKMGCRPTKLHLNPYGVDPERFSGGLPQHQPPNFLSVGRFVEKKAPHLTVIAFSHVIKQLHDVRLTLVGDGPLLEPCKRLATTLGLGDKVIFLGTQDSERINRLMRESRAFVQHSIVARNGDSEGTPVAVIEAQMTGIPVIATWHAGIPDVVVNGETGFLVDEGDAVTMGKYMLQIARDPVLAGKLGKAGRRRAKKQFTVGRHINQLSAMIEKGVVEARQNKSMLRELK